MVSAVAPTAVASSPTRRVAVVTSVVPMSGTLDLGPDSKVKPRSGGRPEHPAASGGDGGEPGAGLPAVDVHPVDRELDRNVAVVDREHVVGARTAADDELQAVRQVPARPD